MKSAPKRGVAMITVLVLLVILMSITITLFSRTRQQIDLLYNQNNYQQVMWYVTSAESLVLNLLSISLKNQERVHLGQEWAEKTRSFSLPQGKISISLTDMRACFNLNILAEPTKSLHPIALKQLVSLLTQADVPVYKAEMIAESLWEFIDKDSSIQTRLGREDSEYLSRPTPFFASNQLLFDISEWRIIQGMDHHIYQKIKPMVCALPSTTQEININTLKIEQSSIITALFTPELDIAEAKMLLQMRPKNGWLSVEHFLTEPILAKIDDKIKERIKPILSVNSDYFMLKIDANVNDMNITINALIFRTPNNHFSVLWHQFGDIE